MTQRNREPDDEAYEEPMLTTLIDGEEARLLVHIEPIDDADAGRRATDEPPPLDQ